MSNRPPPLPPRPNNGHTASQQRPSPSSAKVRNPTASRFHRPARPPTNIPASQASEYIYHDKCTGRTASSIFWFRSSVAPNFLVCATCFENHIRYTPLAASFTGKLETLAENGVLQGDADQWACDLIMPYVQRLVSWASQSGDWSTMLEGIKRRLSIPPCPSHSPAKAKTRTWHRPTAWPHASVCDQCYLDHVALTVIDEEFSPQPVPPGAGETEWTCDLASLAAQEVCDIAVARKDTALVHRFFNVLTTHPPCTPHGIVGGKWYTLKGGCPNFEICAICYTGIIEIYYLDDEFECRTGIQPETMWACDFCIGMPRAISYLQKFAETLVLPRFDIFTSYVRRTAHITPCQGKARVRNAAWWKLNGTENFAVCEDCYENVVRDTNCSDLFTMVGVVEGGVLCCLYSANMRRRYNTLCASSSPSTRADFVAYANHRQSVYAQTVPMIERYYNEAQIKLLQQKMHNSTSSFYQTLDRNVGNSVIEFGPVSTYKTVWESSATGNRYNTAFGIDAENYAAKGRAAAQGVHNDTARIRMLESAWREVE
ncbi:hypothetical protein IAQ61_003424 [Plenodomus lingam]|uniref:uncharacterized protein n=1 Tax=Leptosphaeria maculans TaxID=5022 RepID=UPI00331DFE45|nr:hypothetical protein IAQ61_003424 [Plenodomus lingam]